MGSSGISDTIATKRGRKPGRPRSSEDTARSDFLDAAERRFALNGYHGTTIRAIAEDANANLATLHYYWGTKDALFEAVCCRRMTPIAELQRQRLVSFAADGDAPTPLDPALIPEILMAFFGPFIDGVREDVPRGGCFAAILQRVLSDASPEVARIKAKLFSANLERFCRIMRLACHHLDEPTFQWRLHGVFGTFTHALQRPATQGRVTPDVEERKKADEGLAKLVEFVASGLRAP